MATLGCLSYKMRGVPAFHFHLLTPNLHHAVHLNSSNMTSLRSILGGSRIKKKKSSSSTKARTSSSTASPLSSWPQAKSTNSSRKSLRDNDNDNTVYDDSSRLPYDRLAQPSRFLPVSSIRTVAQALHHGQATIFEPLPASHSGMSSVRIAQVLNYRTALPRAASISHVGGLLSGMGPTAVAREIDAAVRSGAVRRIVVLRRGGIGEVLIPAEQLEEMVSRSEVLDQPTKDGFLRYLRENPGAVRMPRVVVAGKGPLLLSAKQTDQLIRAGFLTAQHTGHDAGDPTASFSRPEDKYTFMSIEAVSRAASGSFAAVGGEGVLAESGGTGGFRTGAASGASSGEGLSLAVPGNGTFLKLVSAALVHLIALLEKTQYKEVPETVLKEKWDGGIASDHTGLAKRARGEFVGVLPGRTKKWKDFYGLSFDWILVEAVGTGIVEVFDTKSVGRGVRLI